MDFWASLEHTLKYKQDAKVEGIDMFDELKDCSDIIQDVERRMQILMHAVQTSDVEEAASRRRAQIEEQEKVVAGVADAASGKPERAISSSTKTVTEAAVQRSISDAAAVREKNRVARSLKHCFAGGAAYALALHVWAVCQGLGSTSH